jgi:hypothetical protein
MKIILLVLLSIFIFAIAEETSDVITLDDKNFEEELKKDYLLVEVINFLIFSFMLHGVDIAKV